MAQHKDLIESAVITYLKEENLYNMLLNEVREIPEIPEQPYMTCFGIDVYEKEENWYRRIICQNIIKI